MSNCCRVFCCKRSRNDSLLEIPLEEDSFSSSMNNAKPIESSVLATKKHFPLWIAICFALNYGIGSGVLGLPLEYYKSGYALSTVIMLWVGLLAYCSYQWVVDGMLRAEAITLIAKKSGISREELLHNPNDTIYRLRGTPLNTLTSSYALDRCEYELNELIGLFCGRKLKIIYEILFTIAMSMELWSYCTLFGASVARHISMPGVSDQCNIEKEADDDCRKLYTIYIIIFWIWTVIITMQDFPQQQHYQTFSTLVRFVVLILMVGTSIGLMYSTYKYNGSGDGNFIVVSNPTPHTGENTKPFKWRYFLQFIAIAGYAYGNQFCATDVISPLRYQDRKKQKELWGWNIFGCGVAFILCGLIVSLYFGNDSESPCTLAWTNFKGFTKDPSNPTLWKTLSYIIVLFPAFDMLSAYPLNAASTANTIEAACLTEEQRHNHKWRILFRFGLCTITNLLAVFIWNFDVIVSLTGAFLLVSVYGGTCLLEYYSKKMCIEITNDSEAYVTFNTNKSFVSHPYMVYACGITTIVAFVGGMINMIF